MRAYLRSLPMIAIAVATGVSAAHAGWRDSATPYDVKRLSLLQESRARGLAESQSGRDAALIGSVLARPAGSTSIESLAGTWRCRTIKLGGMTPDVVYSWFKCRVSERRGGWFFEKYSGSQHVQGMLYPHESGGYVFLGASSVKGEPAHRYSGSGASAGAPATPDDAIGLLVSTGRSSARVEFPYPVQESVFDVIEMKR
jgi:hypothetical protein